MATGELSSGGGGGGGGGGGVGGVGPVDRFMFRDYSLH